VILFQPYALIFHILYVNTYFAAYNNNNKLYINYTLRICHTFFIVDEYLAALVQQDIVRYAKCGFLRGRRIS
jgi:hypothetical protein